MSKQITSTKGPLTRKITITVLTCAILAVPLMLFTMSSFTAVFDSDLKRIDFSRFELSSFLKEAATAIWPFENPHKVFYRLLAGAFVGALFSIGFILVGKRTFSFPLVLGFILMCIALAAFIASQGIRGLEDGTDLEWMMIALSFVLPTIMLWFILSFVWHNRENDPHHP